MAVYRRGGRYWIDFYFGVDENGKPKRLRIPSSENHKEAKAALDRIRGRISSGDFRPEELEPATPTESDGVLFDRVAELYVERKIADGKRADSYGWLFRTDRATKEIIPGPWLQAFGGRPVASITSDEIETHLSAWTKARGLTPATRNRALSQVSGALSFAFRRGWLREHPIRFGRVERFAEDNVRERWLRPHEIQALATQARADGRAYLADVIEFAGMTGKRLGEIVRLRRADFTTDAAGDPALWLGKTKNGTPELLPIAGAALSLVERRANACDSPSARLFPGPRGRSVLQGVVRYFRETVEAVAAKHPDWGLAYGRGKGEVSFHTLRASFATIGSAAGMSERALMVAGNWRTRAMLDRYVRRDDDALRVALGRVGTVVLGTFGEAKAETRAAAPRSHTVVTTDATASEHADAV